MRAFAFICFAAAAPKCWALLDQGSNHPRRLSTNTWEQLKITASDAARYDDFGGSVAIDGNTIVVGAYSDDDGSGCTNEWCDSGSVYVLRTSDGGATYDEVAKLTISDAAADDLFGRSVAIDGDTIVVGAYRKGDYTGAAYVYRTSDGGATYGQVAKLTASMARRTTTSAAPWPSTETLS